MRNISTVWLSENLKTLGWEKDVALKKRHWNQKFVSQIHHSPSKSKENTLLLPNGIKKGHNEGEDRYKTLI